METTRIRPDYQISITDIDPEYDNPSQLQIDFTAILTPDYVRSTDFYIDTVNDPHYDPTEYCADFYDINDYANDQPYLTYRLSPSVRYNGLYFLLQHEPSGDILETRQQAIYMLGKPVIDYITDACRLLNVPFFTND